MASSGLASTSSTSPWSEDYIIDGSLPTVDEHRRLRSVTGLTDPPAELDAERYVQALESSVHCFVARRKDTNEAVGMLRVVGDRHIFLLVVDMAVDPSHQGKGLGKALVAAMATWLDVNAPHAYTSLIADPGRGPGLYSRFGWVDSVGKSMRRSTWGY